MAAVDIVSLITSFIENYHSWVTLVIHENNKIKWLDEMAEIFDFNAIFHNEEWSRRPLVETLE